jgi:orotidine-5'-phosphate decarboxylase
MNFTDKLHKAIERNASLVCLGLDPDPELMPPDIDILTFNKSIIDATSDLVCAYKPNLAFYEALGVDGLAALLKTIEHIPKDIPIIGDAKRGDIGNTARHYAKALFEAFGFDAATVNPYLGYDAVEPFLSYREKGVFLLCRTSNPGASDFQSLPCSPSDDSDQGPLFSIVARKARGWNQYGNVGLVVGATYPEELAQIRMSCPDMVLLVPGIGAQQGDLALAVRHGLDAKGEKTIFASSRQILYASKDKDFAQAARQAAEQLRSEINSLFNSAEP